MQRLFLSINENDMRTRFFLLVFLFIGFHVVAQKTVAEKGFESIFNTSRSLFNDGLYATARVGFDELLESDLPTQSFIKEESSF